MIEVAVIGAGAAGLVTSRYLLENNLRPIIFDTAKTLGGAWSSSSPASSSSSSASSSGNDDHQHDGKMWNGLHTNLSKHTCRFSDWPWPSDTPTFPSSDEMNAYLESYAEEFVDPDCFRFRCHVTNVRGCSKEGMAGDGDNGDDTDGDDDDDDGSKSTPSSYVVEWTDLTSQTTHSKQFSGVVVASGFFSKPYLPPRLFQGDSLLYRRHPPDTAPTDSNNGNVHTEAEVSHSSDYASPEPFANETVAVIGSSFSALEIAVDLSRTANRVVNVLPSIPWVLPRYIIPPSTPTMPPPTPTTPTNTPSTPMPIPLDLAFYRRNKQGPYQSEQTQWTPDDYRKRHEYLATILHQKQSPVLGVPEDFDRPPMVAVSDYYLDLVKSGRIEVCRGRLVRVARDDGDGDSSPSVTLCVRNDADSVNDTDDQQHTEVNEITKIICCMGYQPNLESFLDQTSILDPLEYDPHDNFAPLTLAWDTINPSVLPGFAFCGMTKGIYMGVMELQGRLAAESISSHCSQYHPPNNNNKEEEQKEQPKQDTILLLQEALKISRQIRTTPTSQRPQFPHTDYIGFMDVLAQKALGADYPSPDNARPGDFISPVYYTPNNNNNDDDNNKLCQAAAAAKAEINEEFFRNNHLPGIVTSAMITSGPWKFQRTIRHFHDNNHREEHVHGQIRYSRRGSNLDAVLYREDGLYEYIPGKTMEVFREYEYVVATDGGGADKADTLEIYFVENGQRAHLFLSLLFMDYTDDGYWVATSDHLCIQDLYKCEMKVKLDGMAAAEIRIMYRVKGPAKDYESTTIMRPQC